MSANVTEIFIQHLDGIYWEGFARQLATENPEAYTFEYQQFFNNYNFQSHESERHLPKSDEHYPLAA